MQKPYITEPIRRSHEKGKNERNYNYELTMKRNASNTPSNTHFSTHSLWLKSTWDPQKVFRTHMIWWNPCERKLRLGLCLQFGFWRGEE